MKNLAYLLAGKKKQPTVAVTASLPDSQQFKCLVEKLADYRLDMGFSAEPVQAGWQAIETSSLEADVIVELSFSGSSKPVSIPYITPFVFTCTREQGKEYDMVWSWSLS